MNNCVDHGSKFYLKDLFFPYEKLNTPSTTDNTTFVFTSESLPSFVPIPAPVHRLIPNVKKIVFNDPYTIVKWADNTETKVFNSSDTPYNQYDAFVAALIKKTFSVTQIEKFLVRNQHLILDLSDF